MLLTITTTHNPASDLGYLVEKHPAKCQSFDVSFGQVHVCYPEVTEQRCTVALLLDVDVVRLVRNAGPGAQGTLKQYVNEKPYAASSFLSVAIARVFGSALKGKSRERQELAETAIPLEVEIPYLPCRRGGEDWLRRLFEPLGYEVEATEYPLDEEFPEWGSSRAFDFKLRGTAKLSDLLSHLYVLIPVMDDEKHYYVGDEEVGKLLKYGDGWLSAHPEKNQITRRYLRCGDLSRSALKEMKAKEVSEIDPLQPEEPVSDVSEIEGVQAAASEKKVPLYDQRLEAVTEAVLACGAKKVLDLGCAEGGLIRRLLEEPGIKITGVDVSPWTLAKAKRRLKMSKVSEDIKARMELIQGSLVYRDDRFKGYDAACLVEVIEHIDLARLPQLERVVFQYARPKTVVVTTPNVEYNVHYEEMEGLRHRDHRFEWTREEFKAWADKVAAEFSYNVSFKEVGEIHEETGAPSQMAVFTEKIT